MTMQLYLQGSAITFAKEDVMLGEDRLALLADIERVATIAPGEFVRIPTPIAFVGDRKTIALIHLHAGRLAYALDEHEEDTPAHGEYFLPHPDVKTTVFVDVLNETGATIMIRPGMCIGTMTLINTSPAEPIAAPEPIAGSCIAVEAEYTPKHIDPEMLPAYAQGSPGIALRADLPSPVTIDPGLSLVVPTGFRSEIPTNIDAQLRPGRDLKDGVLVAQARQTSDGEVKVFIQNNTRSPVAVKPGVEIARMVLIPVAMAALDFQSTNSNRRANSGFAA